MFFGTEISPRANGQMPEIARNNVDLPDTGPPADDHGMAGGQRQIGVIQQFGSIWATSGRTRANESAVVAFGAERLASHARCLDRAMECRQPLDHRAPTGDRIITIDDP